MIYSLFRDADADICCYFEVHDRLSSHFAKSLESWQFENSSFNVLNPESVLSNFRGLSQ